MITKRLVNRGTLSLWDKAILCNIWLRGIKMLKDYNFHNNIYKVDDKGLVYGKNGKKIETNFK